MEWSYQDYQLTDDRSRMDINIIHGLLRETYWASQRPKEAIRLSIDHSLCFGLFHRDQQIGIARVLTDRGVTSYLCDVVIDVAHRSRGLRIWFMEQILEHPDIRGTQMLLLTRDAQEFYRKLGFSTHLYECMFRPASRIY